jgi:dTDP-4-dehydrorhamnose reductase
MKILLLGNKGQVGWELQRALLPIGEVIALDSPELDYMNLDLLREQVTSSQAQVIINAAAYTAVDKAESQPEVVNRVNVQAPALLADLACEGKAVLVHFSTDYVFDGTKKTPYTEDDAPNPLSLYAKSKLAGDQEIEARNGAFFILRSSWIYSNRRDNFVKKVFGWAHTQTELRVVTDQVSCPTWARALAEVTAQMLCQGENDLWDWAKAKRGIYNAAGNGYASRYEWAEEILRLDPNRNEQTVQALKPALTADFPADACRPLFTALDCGRLFKTFGLELPDWRVSLHLAIDSM